ncbi:MULTISPECIES: hypothetical protein [Marinobacter]|uniref:hypothetical protein n=1 Tax=Marinobacter sp. TaxID=50741 RepID=UPI0025C40BCC|nr:hypothetical protein [Marinobacter sp.]
MIGAEIFAHKPFQHFGFMSCGRKAAEDAAGSAVSDAPDIGEIRFPAGMAEQAMVGLLIDFTHGCRVQGTSGMFEK